MSLEFKLYPTQQIAMTTKANEILFGGAAGGGKSHLARVAAIVYSLEIPGLITYIFRRTFKEVLSNYIYTSGGFLEMLGPLIQSGDVKFSKSDYSFEFYNGSRIQLCHSQYESNIYDYQGAQIPFLIVDEATHFTPFMLRYIRSRSRLGQLSIPERYKGMFPRILLTANPGGVGHHYIKGGFVDHGAFKIWTAPKDEGGMKRIYIPSKLTDNKVLVENDPGYADRLRGLGSTEMVEALLSGDWDIVSAGGVSDLWRRKHHVVEPFQIPSSWRIDRGYDYGSSNPAAYLTFAESDGSEFYDQDGNVCWVPPKSVFVIGEVYFANERYEGLKLTADQQARRIRNYEEEMGYFKRVNPGPADNAIFSAEPGHRTVSDDMGIHGIKFVRGNKRPGSRVEGLQLFRTMLQSSTIRPLERPGFFVFSNCVHTIRTIPNLQNDDKNTEDIDSSGEDHIWDVIRYRLLASSKKISTGEVTGV